VTIDIDAAVLALLASKKEFRCVVVALRQLREARDTIEAELVAARKELKSRPIWADVFEREIRGALEACGSAHDELDLEECVSLLAKFARRGAAMDKP
jgi:hypothetical protein